MASWNGCCVVSPFRVIFVQKYLGKKPKSVLDEVKPHWKVDCTLRVRTERSVRKSCKRKFFETSSKPPALAALPEQKPKDSLIKILLWGQAQQAKISVPYPCLLYHWRPHEPSGIKTFKGKSVQPWAWMSPKGKTLRGFIFQKNCESSGIIVFSFNVLPEISGI